MTKTQTPPDPKKLKAAMVFTFTGIFLASIYAYLSAPKAFMEGLHRNEPEPMSAVSMPQTEDLTAKATLVRYRVVPFRTAQGLAAKMVLIDWKNTGTVAVRMVKADIDVFDAAGTRLDSSERNYTIYAAFHTQSGVGPGQVHRTKEGEGYVLMPIYGKPVKVTVRLTGAGSQANF